MARSKASWVLSIRVTGGSAEGTEGVLRGLRCGHHPWWSTRVSALRRGALGLAGAIHERDAERRRRVALHGGAPDDQPAHLGAGRGHALLEQGGRPALELGGPREAVARLERRHVRQLAYDLAALLPEGGQLVEGSAAHELQL